MFGNFSEEILSQHPNKAPPTNWFKFTKFSPPKKIQSRTGIETLVLRDDFNQNLQGVTFPSSLEHLTLGKQCNQNLRSVHLPEGLQTLTLGDLVGLHLWQVAGRVESPIVCKDQANSTRPRKRWKFGKIYKKSSGLRQHACWEYFVFVGLFMGGMMGFALHRRRSRWLCCKMQTARKYNQKTVPSRQIPVQTNETSWREGEMLCKFAFSVLILCVEADVISYLGL